MAQGHDMPGFLRDEDGAVTVDWVVLAAGIVLLGVAMGFTVTASLPSLADKASSVVANRPVGGN
ncbi:hypothetical protein [uncultured Maritimibacter sp.]|uniref:Flp family type IVb pilin n=1 Tax=uncultured Maritimibacter sp. TaxID=991866 RepID=UPI0026279395|nr:hypothetical protein [uncultured Maritimibacter sp.]